MRRRACSDADSARCSAQYSRALPIAIAALAANSSASCMSSGEYRRPDSAMTKVIAPIASPCSTIGTTIELRSWSSSSSEQSSGATAMATSSRALGISSISSERPVRIAAATP